MRLTRPRKTQIGGKGGVLVKFQQSSAVLAQSKARLCRHQAWAEMRKLRIQFPWKLKSEDKCGMLCVKSLPEALHVRWKLLFSVNMT